MRRHDDFFQIDFYPPIYPPKVEGEITEEMVRDLMIKQYIPLIEDYIRKVSNAMVTCSGEFWA